MIVERIHRNATATVQVSGIHLEKLLSESGLEMYQRPVGDPVLPYAYYCAKTTEATLSPQGQVFKIYAPAVVSRFQLAKNMYQLTDWPGIYGSQVTPTVKVTKEPIYYIGSQETMIMTELASDPFLGDLPAFLRVSKSFRITSSAAKKDEKVKAALTDLLEEKGVLARIYFSSIDEVLNHINLAPTPSNKELMKERLDMKPADTVPGEVLIYGSSYYVTTINDQVGGGSALAMYSEDISFFWASEIGAKRLVAPEPVMTITDAKEVFSLLSRSSKSADIGSPAGGGGTSSGKDKTEKEEESEEEEVETASEKKEEEKGSLDLPASKEEEIGNKKGRNRGKG
jgi:hypothetical protein